MGDDKAKAVSDQSSTSTPTQTSTSTPTQTSTSTSNQSPANVDITKLAAAGIAVVTAAAAIYGGFTGAIARLARNDFWVIPASIVLAFLAVGLALRASLYPPPLPREKRAKRDRRHRMQTALLLGSVVAFAAAATLITWRLGESLATKDRPSIAIKWTDAGGRTLLTGTVKASGLKTNDQLTVAVVRLLNNGDPPPSPAPTPLPATWTPPTPREHRVFWAGIVYLQTTGPDIDGNVTVPLEVPLPTGYNAMQVIASTSGRLDCPDPFASAGTPLVVRDYACVTMDAPHPELSSTPTPTGTPKPTKGTPPP